MQSVVSSSPPPLLHHRRFAYHQVFKHGLGSGRLDSVHSLSPKQPTLRILASLPVPPAVQIHSIIGNRGKVGPLERSSDGVVPYGSSHLSNAVSEKIVPEGHGCVSHPDTMAEVRRLLAR